MNLKPKKGGKRKGRFMRRASSQIESGVAPVTSHFSFAYSALASLKRGMSGSAVPRKGSLRNGCR